MHATGGGRSDDILAAAQPELPLAVLSLQARKRTFGRCPCAKRTIELPFLTRKPR